MEKPDRHSYERIGELLLEMFAYGFFTFWGEIIAAILGSL
jgi:hypothetical protein